MGCATGNPTRHNGRVQSVWNTVWPLAVAGALSPSITVIVLAILMRPNRPRARALAFWVGAILAMLVWAILISSAMWGLVADTERDLEKFSRAIDVILAVLLIAFAIWRIAHHPKPDAKPRIDLRALDGGSLWKEVAFGAIMQGRNFTSVLLFVAAQQHIDSARLPFGEQLALTMSVIGIMTASIWLPLLLPIRATDLLHSRLTPARAWLTTHAQAIEVGAALVGGAYLLFRGFD